MIVVVIDALPQERRDALGEAMAQTLADVRQRSADHGDERADGPLDRPSRGLAPGVDAEVLAENWNSCAGWRTTISSSSAPRLRLSALEGRRLRGRGAAVQSGAGLGVLATRAHRAAPRLRAGGPDRKMKRQLDLSEPVTVAKANVRSRVHRRAYMDYVGVKRFGADGRPSGETRFVGLFTAEAYDKPRPRCR
jgi:glutamate dehydrogenase